MLIQKRPAGETRTTIERLGDPKRFERAGEDQV
jgi:hypothetical protein